MRAGRRGAWAAAVGAVAVLSAGPLHAQDTTAALRGVVTDTAGAPVPYALVRVAPYDREQFTNALGGFLIAGLPLGTYRVQARQVGYQPVVFTVSLHAEGAVLRIVLRPLAIRLDDLTVTAAGRCTRPGPPDPATDPELAGIFAELRENARRFAVLADSYPFLYTIERTYAGLGGDDNVLWSSTDTVGFRSDSRVRYRPGNVIESSVGPGGRSELIFRLPSLPDLADSTFHANHCFGFDGVVEHDGQRLLRVAFKAAERLRSPDIEGEADLDLDSYQLRYLAIRLTRPDRAWPRLASASMAVTPTELYRNVLIPGMVRGAVVPLIGFGVSMGTRRQVEMQRLLRVHFLRPLPADSTPSP